MLCPRDGATLTIEKHQGIEVDRCPACNGRWLDHHELATLEATVAANEDERAGTVEYAKHASELDCPVCGKRMRAFNYRAYNLEIDTCEEEHGFWLDAGEEGQLRDVMEERVRGLARASSAEESWRKFLGRVGNRSVWDNIKRKLGGR